MDNTRLMSRLFSATDEQDEELTEQVARDIEDAKTSGVVDTEELKYENAGNGKVAITDKENGEVTMAERAADGNYDLYPAKITEQIEGFIHPEGDGVTPGQQHGEPDEHFEYHMDGQGVIAPNLPDGGLNPEAGHEASVEYLAEEGLTPCDCEDEREFSVATDNTVVLRVFSDQEFCERLFSECIESEETVKVGDLKVEKDPEEENAVVVTDQSTGDQAKIVMEDNEMEVTELDSKAFSEEEQYDALHVVGVDTFNHVLVDAPEYTEEDAEDLAARLTEQGVDAVEIFDNADDAREYAIGLLNNLGAESEDDVEEPEQVEFSDHTIYLTKFYSYHTEYMDRLFSEVANDIETSQAAIEDAIENGDQIENDDEIITPIDAKSAVVEDKESGEFSVVTLDGDSLDVEPISERQAEKLTENLSVEDDEDDDEEEDEKDYSEIWSNEDETRFFSEDELMTDYMVRLFSEEADESAIEDAIENGDQIENDNEIITPIDGQTAIVEDKSNGEFTLATMDDDEIETVPVSEEVADCLTEHLAVEDTDEDEDEKNYSNVWSNEDETKFFSEDELMTDYMVRLFTGESDESAVEDAIENGDQIENEDEVITPIDGQSAVVEDKESGEFTLATMDDNEIETVPVSEEVADCLTEHLAVEDTDEDEDEEEKNYTFYDDPILDRFFADALIPQQQVPAAPAAVAAPVEGQDPQMIAVDPASVTPSVETVEDKAVAAVQLINAAAAEAEAAIMSAKAAPVEGQEQNLQEAQFSEKTFCDSEEEDTLVSWLCGNLGY